MSREYTCDNCGDTFADRDWIWPIDERRDYCTEECFHEGMRKGQVIDCPSCHGQVTAPHNCPWKNKAQVTP